MFPCRQFDVLDGDDLIDVLDGDDLIDVLDGDDWFELVVAPWYARCRSDGSPTCHTD
jgi:hypothetical protein